MSQRKNRGQQASRFGRALLAQRITHGRSTNAIEPSRIHQTPDEIPREQRAAPCPLPLGERRHRPLEHLRDVQCEPVGHVRIGQLTERRAEACIELPKARLECFGQQGFVQAAGQGHFVGRVRTTGGPL
jgi:hypothetical protein